MPRPEAKLAGRHKLTAMRKLAEGLSCTMVAEDMGVTPQAVSLFSRRYADEIAEIKADLSNAYAGLWVAKKEARIAELQSVIEDMQNDLLSDTYEGSVTEGRRVVMAALRQASEELGQLVQKGSLTTEQKVKYQLEIDGASTEDLT